MMRAGSCMMALGFCWKSSREIIMFVIPVSSSRLKNTIPFAVSGRCRLMTSPATVKVAPCRIERSSAILFQLLALNFFSNFSLIREIG